MVILFEDMHKKVIEQYQNDEKAMVLIYAQWCINEGFDPVELYKRAYPKQPTNELLLEMLEQTVDKRESQMISTEMVLQMLQLFGNDDLAFVIQEAINERNSPF